MSAGVTGEKPKKPYQELGPDVQIKNLALDKDEHANVLLKDAGSSMVPAGMEYMGSIAVHWYKTTTHLATQKYDIDIKQQFCIGDMNQSVLTTGLSALSHTVARQYLGQKMKSTDPNDKR